MLNIIGSNSCCGAVQQVLDRRVLDCREAFVAQTQQLISLFRRRLLSASLSARSSFELVAVKSALALSNRPFAVSSA
jgi:hypothetical protein